MKKTMQLLCAVMAMLMLFSACGQPAAEQSAEEPADPAAEGAAADANPAGEPAAAGGTLKVVINEENTTLCPTMASPSKCDITVLRNVYQTLTKWNSETGATEPGLATSWEWIDDLHLRVHLNENVVDSNGNPMTANDVVWTFQMGCTGNNVPAFAAMIDPDECSAEDDYTAVIGLLSPCPTLPDVLTSASYFILNQASVEAAGGIEVCNRNPVGGSGPYKFKEWADGQYVTIEKNENYWGDDAAMFYDEIQFSFVADDAARAMAVQSGDADVAFSLQAAQIAALESDENAEVEVFETNGLSVFYMQTNEGPLADENVRKAIAKLVDYDAVMGLVNAGYGQKLDSHIPYKSPYYTPTGVTFERDVEGAKQLLADAGYPDGLDINIFGFSYNSDLLELVQANLAEGGINLSIELTEVVAGLNRMMSGDYELYIGASSGEEPVRLLKMVDGRNNPQDTFGGSLTKDETLYEIVDRGMYTLDDAERLEAYKEAAVYVAEHAIVIPLTVSLSITAKAPGLTGIDYDSWGDLILYNVQPG